MNFDAIPIGDNPPHDINVIIEVPLGGKPIKYEFEKKSGALFVDRFLHTPMFYPGNYGFIPHTLSDDGDALDVIVVGRNDIMPGAVLRSRPIGVMVMEDESGMDEKIIAVPHRKLSSYYNDVENYTDLPKIWIDQISHFFAHYKDLEYGKWAKVNEIEDSTRAKLVIEESIERYKTQEEAEG